MFTKVDSDFVGERPAGCQPGHPVKARHLADAPRTRRYECAKQQRDDEQARRNDDPHDAAWAEREVPHRGLGWIDAGLDLT